MLAGASLFLLSASAQDIPMHGFSQVRSGVWTSEPPTGSQRYTQYLYESPQGDYQFMDAFGVVHERKFKTCEKYLTVIAHTWVCDANNVNVEYAVNGTCVTDALEPMLVQVDTLNQARELLPAPTGVAFLENTCLRLAASSMSRGHNPEPFSAVVAMQDLIQRPPTKHAVVTVEGLPQGDAMSYMAGLLGLPIFLCDYTVQSVERDLTRKPTMFRMATDTSWTIPALAQLFRKGSEVAVVFNDATAASTAGVVEEAARDHGLELSVRSILPSSFHNNEEATFNNLDTFLDQVISRRIRYVFVALPPVHGFSILACRIIQRGLLNHLHVVTLTMPFYAALFADSCRGISPPEVYFAVLSSSWIGISPMSPDPITGFLINRASGLTHMEEDAGDFDMTGQPWAMRAHPDNPWSLNLSHHFEIRSETCADDEQAVNADQGLRRLLRKQEGETLTCAEVVFFGQSRLNMQIHSIAKHCPVSSCEYNWWGSSCRISCACREPPEGVDLEYWAMAPLPSGKPICAAAQDLTMPYDPTSGFNPQLWRCRGSQCRPLLNNLTGHGEAGFYASDLHRYAEVVLWSFMGAGAPIGFCPSYYPTHGMNDEWPGCSSVPQRLTLLGAVPVMGDAVFALASAWSCVERHHGAGALDRVIESPQDPEVSEQVLRCLREEVAFEGYLGSVDFKFFQSPSPGHVLAPLVQAPASVDAVLTVVGMVSADQGAELDYRTFSRDLMQCKPWEFSVLAPNFDCAEGAVQAYFAGDGDEVLPLGRAEDCEPGFYALTIGDPIPPAGNGTTLKLNACARCPSGTYRGAGSGDRCRPCSPGYYSAPGSAVCTSCPVQNYGAPAEEGWVIDLGFGQQTRGSAGCLACATGSVAPLGSAECTRCPPGREVAGPLDPSCLLCEVGFYSNEDRECVSCPETFTTAEEGAAGPDKCSCPVGTYLNRKQGLCKICQEGAHCPGGNDFPLVREGYYATFVPPESQNQTDLFESLQIFQCHTDAACPATLLVPAVGGEVRAREAYQCSDPQLSFQCARCPADTFWAEEEREIVVAGPEGDVTETKMLGVCQDCGAGNKIAFPFFIITVMIGVYTVFRFSKEPKGQGLTGMMFVGSAMSVVMTGMQTVLVVTTFDLNMPQLPLDILAPFRFLLFDIDMLSAACITGSSFQPRFGWRLLTPIFVLTSFFLTMQASKLIKRFSPKFTAMDAPRTANALGLVVSVGYIPLAKTAFQFFECRSHPSAPLTLVAYADIPCASEERTDIMYAGVLAVLLYPVGILTVFSCICAAAPKMYHKPTFRMSTGFMMARWKPHVWFFGLVVMFRNVVIAVLGVAYPADGVAQLAWSGSILVLYATLQATCAPWRAMIVGKADTSVNVVLAVLCGFLLTMVDFRDTQDARNSKFGWIVEVVFACGVSIYVFVGIYAVLFLLGKTGNTAKTSKQAAGAILASVGKLSSCVDAGTLTFDEVVGRMQLHVTPDEQVRLAELSGWVLHEVFGTVPRQSIRSSRRLPSNPLSEYKLPVEDPPSTQPTSPADQITGVPAESGSSSTGAPGAGGSGPSVVVAPRAASQEAQPDLAEF